MDWKSAFTDESRARLEDHAKSAISGIFSFMNTSEAINREILATLKQNTSSIFWWTSWAIGIVLGLFTLRMLGNVRKQLAELNGYQAAFQEMWIEDQKNEVRIRKEEAREKEIERRKKTPTFNDLVRQQQEQLRQLQQQQQQEHEEEDGEEIYNDEGDEFDEDYDNDDEDLGDFLQNPLLAGGGQNLGAHLPPGQREALLEAARRVLQQGAGRGRGA